ncbi:MAG: DUF58 domain-containing protein [Deltaproteobacteria bacterium]|nr:DUF58 domain-containing protein [Deltaproteobacteria bacterium]
MIPGDLIKRLRRLEIRTRKVVSDMLAGQYQSVFKGRGMAFSEVRPYQPGDEIRLIDWNVTARMNEPFIKVFTEERELTVMLLVDVSGSKDFGSGGRTKAEIAAEVAAQVAFSAIANNDRVGLILFSDRVERTVPPRKGRKHVMRLVTEILSWKPAGTRTSLSVPLTWLSRVVPRKAVVFLVSDFLAQGYERELKLVGRKHDLVPVVIRDPLEEAFPAMGLVDFEDPETGERQLVDTSDPAVRARFARAMGAEREERLRLFRKLELDHVELRADDGYAEALHRFFETRARRLAA